jgi:hypothetical protein
MAFFTDVGKVWLCATDLLEKEQKILISISKRLSNLWLYLEFKICN